MLVELDKMGTLLFAHGRTGKMHRREHLAQLESLGNLGNNEQHLNDIGKKAKRTGEALHVEDERDKTAQGASGVRVEEYKLKSRVTLADVTVQITGKPQQKKTENPYRSSAKNSYHALAVCCQWLLTTLLIPLGIWLPVWASLAGIAFYVRRRWLGGGGRRSDQ